MDANEIENVLTLVSLVTRYVLSDYSRICEDRGCWNNLRTEDETINE